MTTVAEYLVTRLRRLGVDHVFGVPGDYSLGLVEALAAPGRLEWVGTANELGAGYAADGYARRRGLGVLCTTFGVGELSALNAVAGAYAEHVPVVHLVGLPATTRAGLPLHHTLADGDHEHTLRAAREFTAAAEVLTAADAAVRIDEVLRTALTRLRPVHLGIPADLVEAELDADHARRLDVAPAVPGSDPEALAAFRAAAAELLSERARPVLLVGHLVRRLAATRRLETLARVTGGPVAHLLSGRGTLDETSAEVIGFHAGRLGPDPVREVVEAADPLITVGATLTDVVSGFFSHRPDPDREIVLDLDVATVAGRRFADVRLVDALDALIDVVPARPAGAARPEVASDPGTPAADRPTEVRDAISQLDLWRTVQDWLPASSTLVTDIGTAFWGAAGLVLPPDTAFLAQPDWSSIGYALPAALGASLAEPGRRTVLITGDGAAQMTAAELGLLARRAAGGVVLILDNAGYTIERALRRPDAAHHDVPRWDWPALAAALSPDHPPLTRAVRTGPELLDALKHADDEPNRLTLLHVILHPLDAPPLLRVLAEAATGRRP